MQFASFFSETRSQYKGSEEQQFETQIERTAFAASEGQSRVGQFVGPYKLVKVLGEGGMGSVYLAQQEQPIQRQLAVKVIRHGLRSSQSLARFEMEQHTLARMDHPNIAKIYDAGLTELGEPFFAMELIDGVSIADYCLTKKLSYQQSLEIFSQVCAAVQHAHSRGIIHRDLKPQNILVTEKDGRAIPKLIDFGLSKEFQSDQELGHTSTGQVLGTLPYMSPEQTASGDVIDTRTDIYALGVVLYELLTRVNPIAIMFEKPLDVFQAIDVIRHKDPVLPSVMIKQGTNASSGNYDSSGSQSRRLHSALSGDLDWIVMKAMEKSPQRRYATSAEMQLDLQAYFSGLPVSARPPTWNYRIGKLVKRHRRLVATTIIVTLVTLTAGVFALRATIQSSRDARIAQSRSDQLHVATNLLEDLFDGVNQSGDSNEPLEAVLAYRIRDAANEVIDSNLGEPLAVASLLDRMAAAMISLSYASEAVPLLKRVNVLAAQATNLSIEDEFQFKSNLGLALEQSGDSDEAARYLQSVWEEFQSRHIANAIESDRDPSIALQNALASALIGAGKTTQAINILRPLAKELRETSDGESLSVVLNGLAVAAGASGDLNLAESVLLSILEEGQPKILNRRLALGAKKNLGTVYHKQGRLDEAKSIFFDILSELEAADSGDLLFIADVRNGLGTVLAELGQFDESVKQLRMALEQFEKSHGKNHLTTLNAKQSLAMSLVETREVVEAEAFLQDVIRIRRDQQLPDDPDLPRSINYLGQLYLETGELDRAAEQFQIALDSLNRTSTRSESKMLLTTVRQNFAITLRRLQQYDRALELMQDSQDELVSIHHENHPEVLMSQNVINQVLRESGRLEEAFQNQLQLVERYKKHVRDDDPERLVSENNLAQLHEKKGELAIAETMHRDILARKIKFFTDEHRSTVISKINLARVLSKLRQHSEAIRYMRQAVESARNRPGFEKQIVEGLGNELSSMEANAGTATKD